VRVLPIRIEPGDCEFGTCCVRTKGDEIATELRTNLLLTSKKWRLQREGR